MNKRLAALAFAVLLSLAAGCSAVKEKGNTFEDIEINPMTEAAKNDTMTVALYFGSTNGQFLVSETRSIDTPVNDRTEVFILEELIKGPTSASGEFNELLNENTKVVSVSDNGEVLTVILSNELLEWPFSDEAATAEKQKELAIYSIVNTLVESSGFSRIQILVDRDENGAGQRIKLGEIGLGAGKDDNSVLSPLARSGELVLSPENTIKRIFEAMTKKEYASLYSYIAYNDNDGNTKPEQTVITSAIQEKVLSIEGYTVGDVVVSGDGQSAIVMMDYTMRLSGGQTTTFTVIPAALIKENGIWKQQYHMFRKLFMMDAEG